ncbi:MAG: hypothetical protein IBJ11_04825 [Phycisphaerales bacterium]|nr:hypothetical protein [Phycisphaerales bacterium]
MLATSRGPNVNNAYGTLTEAGSTLLSVASFSLTSGSVQIYAGRVYQLELVAQSYSSDRSFIYAELGDPVPAPTGALVLAAAGVFAARRRR